MRIIRWDESDASVFQGCVTAEQAAHETDDPAGPPTSAARMRVALGPSANVVKETWYAAGPGVAGYYRLRLPEKENLDSAFLTLTVHPAHRRQGIGAELLRHAAGRVPRAAGPSWRARPSRRRRVTRSRRPSARGRG